MITALTADGTVVERAERLLSPESSAAILSRSGAVARIDVHLRD